MLTSLQNSLSNDSVLMCFQCCGKGKQEQCQSLKSLSTDSVLMSFQCSVSCGQGKQERTVQCQSFNGQPCNPALRPAAVQDCNSPCGQRPDVESEYCTRFNHCTRFTPSPGHVMGQTFLCHIICGFDQVHSAMLSLTKFISYSYQRIGYSERQAY